MRSSGIGTRTRFVLIRYDSGMPDNYDAGESYAAGDAGEFDNDVLLALLERLDALLPADKPLARRVFAEVLWALWEAGK